MLQARYGEDLAAHAASMFSYSRPVFIHGLIMDNKWAYYNDNDPYACQWVRNLIAAGHISDGEVDERPIQQVMASDVVGFRRVHFFCGIAGWELALRLAGWPDDRPVWTGSCPCQPHSSASRGRKVVPDLWHEFARLIAECHPAIVFGEQVDEARTWLDVASAMTWKPWVIPSGRQFYRLTVSRKTILENGFTLLATPTRTANQAAPSMRKHPGCIGIEVTPQKWRTRMGYPAEWAECAPMGIP